MTEVEKDMQIADLVRARQSASEERGHLRLKHEAHVSALSGIITAARIAPRW